MELQPVSTPLIAFLTNNWVGLSNLLLDCLTTVWVAKRMQRTGRLMTEYKVQECGGRHVQLSNLPGQNKNYHENISQERVSLSLSLSPPLLTDIRTKHFLNKNQRRRHFNQLVRWVPAITSTVPNQCAHNSCSYSYNSCVTPHKCW